MNDDLFDQKKLVFSVFLFVFSTYTVTPVVYKDLRNATFALNKASIENCMENSFHINRTGVRFCVINVVFFRGWRES